MTTTPDDGGPAFPFEYTAANDGRLTHSGISTRLYIATQVLAGMQAWFTPHEWQRGPNFDHTMARVALAQSDALIAASKENK